MNGFTARFDLAMADSKAMLVLDGVPELPALAEAVGGKVVRLDGPSAAARAIAELSPALIVFRWDSPWQRELVAGVSPEKRPAVLAVGTEAPELLESAVADDWLHPERDRQESAVRWRIARERARTRRLAARRAFYDFLTGLPNRRASVRALIREAARSRRLRTALSLVLIDLDDFKAVNELGGHPAGDRLLRQVGQALRSVTRGSEFSGRIGGDEFAMVISGDAELGRRAARRVEEALRACGVSATTAVSSLGANESLKELYRRADGELSRAKEDRRRARAAASREPAYAS